MQVIRFWDPTAETKEWQIRGGGQWRIGVAREGTKLLHIAAKYDTGVALVHLPRTIRRETVLRRGVAYPIKRACRLMLDAGRDEDGKLTRITKGAKEHLREGLA